MYANTSEQIYHDTDILRKQIRKRTSQNISSSGPENSRLGRDIAEFSEYDFRSEKREEPLESQCAGCRRRENFLRHLMREREQIQYQIQYKDIALTKREELMSMYAKDNQVLREKLKAMQKLVDRLKSENKSSANNQNQQPTVSQGYASRPRSSSSASFSRKMLQSARAPNELITLFNEKEETNTEQIQKFVNAVNSKNSTQALQLASKLNRGSSPSNGVGDGKSQMLQSWTSYARHQPSKKKNVQRVHPREFTEKTQLTGILMPSEDQLKKFSADNRQRLLWLLEYVEASDEFFEKLSLDTVPVRNAVASEIRNLVKEMQQLTHVGLMLRRTITLQSSLAAALSIDSVVNDINYHLRHNIECEKARFYVYDQQNNEFWTQEERTNEIRKLCAESGMLLQSVRTMQISKSDDVAYDTRYDAQIDSESVAVVRTVLWMPVLDREQTLRGMLHLVNFKPQGDSEALDVQEVLSVVTQSLGDALSRSAAYDQAILNQYRCKMLLQDFRSQRANGLGLECLREVVKTDKCRLYLINSEGTHLLHYEDLEQEKPEEIDIKTGICGYAVRIAENIDCDQHHIHPNFNLRVDVDTQLHSYTRLIKYRSSDDSVQQQRIYGVFQFASLWTQSGQKVSKQDLFYEELIAFFSQLLTNCISRIYSEHGEP